MTTIDTELFIGGPNDGERKATDASMNVVKTVSPGRASSSGAEIVSTFYHRTLIAGAEKTFAFWLADGTSVDDALERLFDVYPSKRS